MFLMLKTFGLPLIFFLLIFVLLMLQQPKSPSPTDLLTNENFALSNQLASVSAQLKKLQETDQIKRNDDLEKEIKTIETTYKKSVTVYEDLLDLKVKNPKLDKKSDAPRAQAISELADRHFASAEATLKSLDSLIAAETAKLVAAAALQPSTQSAPANNTAPGSGYSRQTVHTDQGDFLVDIIAADLGSTKVIVDTASDETCPNNCPVLSLADYVSRSGAFAGVNGSYFCPADYPSCAGKTNSFDLLAMNKNKHYLNSDNNVYSTNPAVIFGGNYVRFVGKAQEWGRDTGVDGVLSNFPLLLSGGNITFSDAGDAKQSSRGNRSFVAAKGNTVYIGVNNNATVAQSAVILKALGLENAMNLDDGGSTALWFGGYKIGPGRALPNVILLVRK